MRELNNMKIKRTTYSFGISNPYNYERRYGFVEKPPVEKIKEKIFDIFRKKEKKSNAKAPLSKKIEEKPKKQISPLKIGIVFTLLFFIIFGGWLYFAMGKQGPPIAPPVFEQPSIQSSILNEGVITYGETAGKNIGYLTLKYKIEGLENNTVELIIYDELPVYQVYLLSEPRDASQTEGYDEFESYLIDTAEESGILIGKIGSGELKTIQKGSLVIVPTARIPEFMVSGEDSNIKELLDRGVNIIYIGGSFETMITENGEIKKTPNEAIASLGIIFKKSAVPLTERIKMKSPLYTAFPEGSGGVYLSSLIYGSVSVIEKKGSAMLFFPQTLDAGWETPQDAADDIIKTIIETPWIQKDEGKKYKIEKSNETKIVTYFTNSFDGENKYVGIILSGSTSKGKIQERNYFNIEKMHGNGELYIQGGTEMLSTSVSQKTIRITYQPEEQTKNSNIYPNIRLVKDGEEAKKEQLSNEIVSTIADYQKDIQLDLEEGEYIMQFVDPYNTVFAEGYVNSLPLKITSYIEGNKFYFTFLTGDKKVILKEVKVIVDNGKLGEYTYTDSSTIAVDLSSKLGSDELAPGYHEFKFQIGDLEKKLAYNKPKSQNPLEEPIILIAIVLGILALGVGAYFAARQKPKYYLDIPDFPPTEYAKVSITPETILETFKKENEYHKWEFTPLTLGEIKSGLRKTFYKGRQLLVSDFNLLYVLDKLVKKRRIKTTLDYYLPAEWEKQIDRSAAYLGMFRKLRDICVNNAIPFTRMGEVKGCDSKISIIGQDTHVHIFNKEGTMETLRNLLKSVKKGVNIILVKNDFEKDEFKKIMFSPTDIAALLKTEYEGKSISILTMEEFEERIKEMKS